MKMVGKKLKLKVDVIIEVIKNKFDYEISYKKVWYAKKKALTCIFGN